MGVMSAIWPLIGLITLLQRIIPQQLNQKLQQWWQRLQDYFNIYYHVDAPEFIRNNRVGRNELYKHVELYLGNRDTLGSARRVTMSRSKNSRRVEFALASSQTMEDCFRGATFWWKHDVEPPPNKYSYEKRSFTLKMAKADKCLLSAYIDHVADCAEESNRRNRDRLLYTNSGHGRRRNVWSRVAVFKHPSTFETLALDPALKATILTDLDRFSQAKELYARVGRPWKRGYLLHGPPGTGKSSLIAAIANYLKYDVYDLELTKIHDNSELRALLLQTTDKSIIVIEDIDCALDLTERLNPKPAPADDEDDRSRFTLSGLLNFTDGLWSCCGEQRIIVYTTNRKETLDPALLRCGRMDMHILLSHCTFPAFRTLAFNYLLIKDHHLFPSVRERMMKGGGGLTPAEITEILIQHLDDPVEALNTVISVLDTKIQDAQVESPSVCDPIAQPNPLAEAEAATAHIQEEASTLRRRRSAEPRQTKTPADG